MLPMFCSMKHTMFHFFCRLKLKIQHKIALQHAVGVHYARAAFVQEQFWEKLGKSYGLEYDPFPLGLRNLPALPSMPEIPSNSDRHKQNCLKICEGSKRIRKLFTVSNLRSR